MFIRTLKGVDVEELIHLRKLAIEEHPEYFSSTVEEVDAGLEPIEARLDSEDECYLGAFDQARLVGMVRLSREQGMKLRHQATAGSLFVLPAVRRNGIARALMLSLIELARSRGIEQLTLEVGSDNQNAHRLYDDLGFVVYGRAPRAIKTADRYWDEDLMVLSLNYGEPHQFA